MSWLRRNARPILWVLLASAVVIMGFEIVDAVVGGGAPADEDAEAAMGLSVAGLIKVTAFLAVGYAVTAAVRRSMRHSDDEA